MSSRKRDCPKCGTAMLFRLGEMECPECGHHEPMEPRSRPEARQPVRSLSPPPHAGNSVEPARLYTPQSHAEPESAPSSLLTEKIVLTVAYVIGSAGTVWTVAVPEESRKAIEALGYTHSSMIAATAILETLRLLLLAWALFGRSIKLKWVLAAVTLFSLLWMIGGLLFGRGVAFVAGEGILNPVQAWAVGALNVGVAIWLMSILVRDIEAYQGE